MRKSTKMAAAGILTAALALTRCAPDAAGSGDTTGTGDDSGGAAAEVAVSEARA